MGHGIESWTQFLIALTTLLGVIGSGVMAVASWFAARNTKAVLVERTAKLDEVHADTAAKLNQLSAASDSNADKLDELHKTTNGLTAKLLEATRAAAYAAGMKAQKDRGDA